MKIIFVFAIVLIVVPSILARRKSGADVGGRNRMRRSYDTGAAALPNARYERSPEPNPGKDSKAHKSDSSKSHGLPHSGKIESALGGKPGDVAKPLQDPSGAQKIGAQAYTQGSPINLKPT